MIACCLMEPWSGFRTFALPSAKPARQPVLHSGTFWASNPMGWTSTSKQAASRWLVQAAKVGSVCVSWTTVVTGLPVWWIPRC